MKESKEDAQFVIKKGYPSISKTFRLPINICNRLEELANENNLSLNALVVQCIMYALEHLGT